MRDVIDANLNPRECETMRLRRTFCVRRATKMVHNVAVVAEPSRPPNVNARGSVAAFARPNRAFVPLGNICRARYLSADKPRFPENRLRDAGVNGECDALG
jgi:hypothetical protein